MAGFETIVRPVVFPVIRPTPAPSAAPKDDPNQGKAVITGSSGKIIDLPYSYSVSSSQSRTTETKRQVDQVRVYQKDDDGTVSNSTFVDLEVANKVWMQGSPQTIYFYTRTQQADNIEIRNTNIIRKNPN